MKKKFLSAFAVIVCVFSFAFCACDSGTPPDGNKSDHTHNFINYVSDNNTTCTQDGTKTAKCEICDQTHTVKEYAFGHNYSKYICTRCGGVDPEAPSTEGLQFDEIRKNGIVVAYSVSGIGTANGTDIIIPPTYNSKPVNAVETYAFYNCTSVSYLVIPDSVTFIGEWAFSYCTSLKDVFICGDNVSIGNYAFYNCTSLINAGIPDGVASIGESSFRGCDSLKYNEFDNARYLGNNYNAYVALIKASDYAIKSCGINNKTKLIADNAFRDCKILKNIIVPDSVTAIGNDAFRDCELLTDITIPDGVTSIGNYAFRGCQALKSIIIPDSVISVGYEAFGYCDNLKYNKYDNALYLGNSDNPFSVLIKAEDRNIIDCSINANVKVIGGGAFECCQLLTSIAIPRRAASIGEYAFRDCISLADINIPDGVKAIGSSAFYGCTSLKDIKIPDSVISLGALAFYGCTSLSGAAIGFGVAKIEEYTFYNCSSLESVIIPDSVTAVGHFAFGGCTSLINLTIPDSVSEIGNSAFTNCTSLTGVILGNSVTKIGSQAFSGCILLKEITVPAVLSAIGGFAFSGCKSLAGIKFEGAVAQWEAIKKVDNWNIDTGNYTVICSDGTVKK